MSKWNNYYKILLKMSMIHLEILSDKSLLELTMLLLLNNKE